MSLKVRIGDIKSSQAKRQAAPNTWTGQSC